MIPRITLLIDANPGTLVDGDVYAADVVPSAARGLHRVHVAPIHVVECEPRFGGGEVEPRSEIKCGADWMLAGPRALTSEVAMGEANTGEVAARPATRGVRGLILGMVAGGCYSVG